MAQDTSLDDFLAAHSAPKDPAGGAPGKPQAPSDLDGFLAKHGGGEAAKPQEKKGLGARIATDVAGLVDLPLSIAGMAGGVVADVGARIGTAAAGASRKEAAKLGKEEAQKFAEPLMNPIEKLMNHFGYGSDYQASDVTNALGVVTGWIDKGAEWIEEHTGGAILKEDATLLTNAIMTGGPEGVVRVAKAVTKAKPKATVPSAAVPAKPGAADFMKKLDEGTAAIEKGLDEKVKEAHAETKPEDGFYEVKPRGQAKDEVSWGQAMRILQKPGFDRTTEERLMLQAFNKQKGGISPEMAVRLGLASAGALAGLYAVGGDDLQEKLGVSAMAAAVFAGAPEAGRAMGSLLKGAAAGSRMLERLPKNKTVFSKEELSNELKRQDIPKAEREVIGKIIEETPGEALTAKDLMQGFKLATQDFELTPETTDKYADYGLKQIRPGQGEDFVEGEFGVQLPAQTDVWKLPEKWGIPAKGHFQEMGPNQYGHTRSFVEDGTRHVVEIQSDLLQHAKALSPEEFAKVQSDLELTRKQLKEIQDKISTVEKGSSAEKYFAIAEEDLYRQRANAQTKLLELQAKEASGKIAEGLGPILKNWDRRLIQEELARAGRAGEEKVRFATADTVALVEGWPKGDTSESIRAFLDNPRSNITPEFRSILEKKLAKGEYPEYSDFEDPKHKSIYDRYAGETTRYLKGIGAKEVKDAEGHTWLEVPTKKGMPPNMWGKADPKLLLKIAGGSAGAVAGIALADQDQKALGALVGAGLGLAGAGLISSRAFPRIDPQVGVRAGKLSDDLHRLVQAGKANQIELFKFAGTVPKDYQAHAEEIYHSFEDPTAVLSPRAKELKEQFVEPFMRQNAALRAQLKGEGVDVGEDVDAYVHRLVKGRPSIFEKLAESSPQGRSFSQFAPPLEERTVFSLKDPLTGETAYGVKDEKGKGFTVYSGKKTIGQGTIGTKLWDEGKVTFKGREWERSQATTKDIEANTPIEYYHDALASAISSNARLTKIYNNVKFVKGLLKSPEASEIAMKKGAPPDWREVHGVPQFRDYKFEPRVANVLKDFINDPSSDLIEQMSHISRVLTGSMFWNPLPHIFNVLDHSVVQRGLVSGWANPAAYPRLVRTTIRAAKAVTEQNEDYLRFVKDGAGLMYPQVMLADFSQKILERLGHAEEMSPVAKAWGYANPVEMVKRIYGFSRNSLWAANDIIMMQAFLEKEMVKPGNVIKDVEKHIPNYRVPDQVLGSRMLSEALRNPLATAFGRYDYGRMRSYGEMVKDLIGKDRTIKDRAKALDQMAMIAFTGLVVYPLVMDQAAKALTGDPSATMQRFGASTIPWLVYEYLHQKKSASQVAGSAFPESPAVKTVEELRNNRDLFTGKHLIEKPEDLGMYMVKQISPLGTAARIQEGKMSPEQFIWSALGIRIPSKGGKKKSSDYAEEAMKGAQ